MFDTTLRLPADNFTSSDRDDKGGREAAVCHSDARSSSRYSPPVPKTVAETGLPRTVIEQLIVKTLYSRGESTAGEIANRIGLNYALLEGMIHWYKHHHLVQVKGSSGIGAVSDILSLTESGNRIARDYLEINQYVGPAPVPISQYAEVVRAQRLPSGWLTPDRLTKAYRHMVVEDKLLDQIGPAVSSGKSFLIYGLPGDGKTSLAEAVFQIPASNIFLPYALECQGNIIQLYSPLFHQLVEDEPEKENFLSSDLCFDGRWAHCKRPFIVTGGELSLSMLDLTYNPVSKIYEAPYQLKANNGTYLIDDLGRQKATPTEILNRWIMPMERRIDYLSFVVGGKMSVPFETFLIFSTNLRPDEIGDEAFLRRIQYKMLLPGPKEDEFRSIFVRFCEAQDLPVRPGIVDSFIKRHYIEGLRPLRRCHPRDVVTQAIEYIRFKALPYELTEEVLDWAFSSCFGCNRTVQQPQWLTSATVFQVSGGALASCPKM